MQESKKRIWILLALFAVLFFIILIRLIDLQLISFEFYREKSLEQRSRVITLAAPRGDIFDRSGKLLATSIDTYSIFLIPSQIKKEKEVAQKLSQLLVEDEETILNLIHEKKSFVWLKRKVEEEIGRAVEKARLPGVGVTREKKRIYPKGKLASQILGFAGMDNQGLSGVELSAEKYLKGVEGKLLIEIDPSGREIITGQTKELEPPVEGLNLTLTIDETIQYLAEKELEEAIKKHQAKSGSIVIMDPKTGEILAMAAFPDFDPNEYSEYPPETWQPAPSSHVYEPGSTFKVITAAAGLEERLYAPETVINCPERLEVGGKIIENSHPIRTDPPVKTLTDVVAESINTGMAQVGIKLGPERFMKYIKAFGFGEPTGAGLPGESRGILREVEDWYKPDIGMITFGQSIAVTPLQLTVAISSIANGGIRLRPQLIKKIESVDQSYVKITAQQAVKTVISRKTVAELKKMMEAVVYQKNGTGHLAKLAGWRVAAKSGTAEKPAPGGGYLVGHYVASFVGFVPAENPALAILVVVDDPQMGKFWGATVAAPVFKKLAEGILPYLNIPPDRQISSIESVSL